MEATIDRFGRIVIPKELRDLFGLKPGTTLRVDSSNEEILLKPVQEEPQLIRKNGVLVISTELPSDFDIVSHIENERNARIRHLLQTSEGSK
ncbi:MAG: AbrB/MazE/SpoVT family DNA-binding domain-containing protein [Candidatus Ozemobacteraceae bacterium]